MQGVVRTQGFLVRRTLSYVPCPAIVCSMRISQGLKQSYDVQNFTYESLMALKASLSGEGGSLKITREDASAIYQLVRSWQTAQERISFHRRVPRPGVLKPEKPNKVKQYKWASVEPIEIPRAEKAQGS